MNTGGVTLDVGKMTSNKKETYKQTHKPPKTQKSRARWLPRGILSSASRRKTTYATKAAPKDRKRWNTSKLVLGGQHHLNSKTQDPKRGQCWTDVPD